MTFNRRGLGQLPNLVSIPKGYQIPNATGLDLMNLAAWHFDRIGQLGYLAAQPEGSIAQPLGMPSNPAATSRRVWVEEPPGSIPFDEKSFLTLPPSAGFGVFVPVLTFTVPLGFDGVIKWISNNVLNDVTGAGGNPVPFVPGSVTWQITVNSRAVKNFGNIVMENGTPFQGREESPIRIFSGDVVQYLVSLPTGSTVNGQTVCSLTGYYFPSKGIS